MVSIKAVVPMRANRWAVVASVLAPVLSFTAEDVWRNLPGDKEDSVFLAGFARGEPRWEDDALLDRWSVIREVRREVTKVLEVMRKAGDIGNALQAQVVVRASGPTLELLRDMGNEVLTEVFLVSAARVEEGAGEVQVEAHPSDDPKCPRCWRLGNGVGTDSEHPDLCTRCAGVVRDLIAAGNFELEG